ncbi:Conserved hypothetical protein [Candidatus Protochlamydia naegleriophila]|uniref:Uncharacterized protein n=1 Tax=Candidatus Protochlamydia naegleriophila TaxID=389348 RepID=A0A0U5JEK0_9BACT|nr:hypothetical protein [Candidatus Protochlamydia naegleriophila]CUI16799.1 Conserved hypothetical protein [Candidatus Protochlamydia naegleriophila]
MLNITNREFNNDTWNQMVIEAAESRISGREHKNICRVIYPNGACTLELKTNQEVKNHLQTYGSWNANCAKMSLKEVLNLTRICSLNHRINSQTKASINDALFLFGFRAAIKYENGFKGILRRVTAVFFNIFVTDSVALFSKNVIQDLSITVADYSNRGMLPLFIGSNANFAYLINTTRFS